MLNLFQIWRSGLALQQENPGFMNRLVTMLGRAFLCGACMFSPCQCGGYSGFSPQSKDTQVRFICHSKLRMDANVSVNRLLAKECMCVFASLYCINWKLSQTNQNKPGLFGKFTSWNRPQTIE